jgi:methionyl-tRNA formyltransferase
LEGFCIENNIEVYTSHKYSLKSEEDTSFFKKKMFQLGFVVGWQRLVPETILETFSIGVFGMHGSAMNLPKGRGRSPMNWSIIEGRKVFYTNLFKYDNGADDGDVLDTFKFQVSDHDTGETMHFKNTLAMKFLIEDNIENLLNRTFKLTKQPTLVPTYYPKRNESDSLIDWSDDSINIDRLIRAVTKPFNGAYSFIRSNKIIIYRANIFDFQEFGFDSSRPGEVVAVYNNGKFLIKSFGGLLLVHEYETNIKVHIGDLLSNGEESKNIFQYNKHGFHDLK